MKQKLKSAFEWLFLGTPRQGENVGDYEPNKLRVKSSVYPPEWEDRANSMGDKLVKLATTH